MRKKKQRNEWILIKTFDNADEARAYLQKEGNWSKGRIIKLSTGDKQNYRCNRVKKKGQQCASAAQLMYHNTSFKVSLFKTSTEHTCLENHPNSKAGVPLMSRQTINDYVSCGVKPKTILQKLRENNLPIPTYRALCNYIKYNIRNNKSTISLGELENWCIENSKIPDDDDTPFIVNYVTFYDDEFEDSEDVTEDDDTSLNYFRFFLTTKRLMQLSSESTKLHADATYKLVWQGYPFLIPGTTDGNRKFHPFGLAVCTNERQEDFEFIFESIKVGLYNLNMEQIKVEVLIADGSDAIRNAFSKTFNCQKMVMCWAHMLRACKKNMPNISKETKEELIDDIKLLQL